jgi:hypothetical protein
MQPELRDVLDKYKFDISRSINCVQIGTIKSYNASLNTAEISVNFKTQLADGRIFDGPVLADCPVFVLSGGGAFINMPIVAGDTCIVLFNDRDIDTWWFSGQVYVPNSPRAHSFSDGIALVGIRPLTNPLGLDASAMAINAGVHLLQVKNSAKSLLTILNSLIDLIAAITVTCAAPGNPSSIPVNNVAITAIKAQLALLLEA